MIRLAAQEAIGCKGGNAVSSDIRELKQIIQAKLAKLEKEKADLQEKLLVVGQVESFAHELERPSSSADA